MTRGAFVVLAGCDACGKDRQADALDEWLRGRSLETLRTREPSDHRIGSMIRGLLQGGVPLDPVQMALLFAADRAEHVRQIMPLVERGAWVVTTRYIESSIVYQSLQLEAAGVRAAHEWVRDLNRHFPPADLTVVLDVSARCARERLQRRGDLDAYERDILFQEAVAERYRSLEFYADGHLVHVDGERESQAVHADVRRAVEAWEKHRA